MTRRAAAAGFSLVEVLVALAILEVGMLAAAGTLLLAARTMADAARLERAAADAAALADSLLTTPGAGDSEVERPGYRLRWERVGPGWRLTARTGDRSIVDVTVPWAP
ncbi:MAG: prepilin-type N-terminal cleavage/methylation domain-containing protein [Gemmatimonadetes bacterium]|nr:prepilin-type N-terminal cleavage/methylation domain-containing protein [Gemmatimonadota bacterium]